MKSSLFFIKTLIINWFKHDISREAACIAFYTIFSLAPCLVIGVYVTGIIFEKTNVQEQIVSQVEHFVGSESAHIIQTILKHEPSVHTGKLATIISTLILIYGSSLVFSELRFTFNKIFGIAKTLPSARNLIIKFIQDQLLSFTVVLLLGFFIIFSLITSAVFSGLSEWLNEFYNFKIPLVSYLHHLITLVLIGTLFCLLVKLLPNRHIPWKFVLPSALVSTILFSLTKYLTGLYLAHSTVSSAFGAAGSVIAFLIYIYFTINILLLGAEICNALIEKDEERNPTAVPIAI